MDKKDIYDLIRNRKKKMKIAQEKNLGFNHLTIIKFH